MQGTGKRIAKIDMTNTKTGVQYTVWSTSQMALVCGHNSSWAHSLVRTYKTDFYVDGWHFDVLRGDDYTEWCRKKVKALTDEGYSNYAIAKKTGYSRSTVAWLLSNEPRKSKAKEPENFGKIVLDETELAHTSRTKRALYVLTNIESGKKYELYSLKDVGALCGHDFEWAKRLIEAKGSHFNFDGYHFDAYQDEEFDVYRYELFKSYFAKGLNLKEVAGFTGYDRKIVSKIMQKFRKWGKE